MSVYQALFSGLVYNEQGQLAETKYIGDEAHYVILDDDFKRHVPAQDIDRQVLGWVQAQADANKDIVSEQMMKMMGKDDLFTKAMIDSSITHMDEQVMERGLPEDARTMLGMMGFKVIVNVHGELVELKTPEPDPDNWPDFFK